MLEDTADNFNNKHSLKEILLQHKQDFLGLKSIILKLNNSVKKWKERRDAIENPINVVIIKLKTYLKTKNKNSGLNKD